MTNGTFQKVGTSEKRMFGPPCLIICGYGAEEQPDILSLIEAVGLSECPVVFAREEDGNTTLGDMVAAGPGKGKGLSSGLSRAIIMSGLSEKDLHLLLSTYRNRKLPRQLWATLTPVSVTWTLDALLQELALESDAFKRRQETGGAPKERRRS